jgi:hypothetical protein
MNLLISGSREIAENDANFSRLKKEIQARYPEVTILLHGGARGVDRLADRFGREYGVEMIVIRPDYRQHPEKLAPLMRNTELVARADAVIAFYGPRGKTGGTLDTVKKALARNLPVTELFRDGTVRYSPPQRTLFL